MTKRTWWYTLVTTLLISGLAACSGGGGGGGGGGGSGIPSATNAAITPPPTTPVTITSATAGQPASQTNQTIGANGFQASDGAKDNASAASGLGQLSAQADSSGTQAQSETLGAIVRRHAEKLKDHKSSVTGALQVQTEPCSGGGTATFAFDDASQSATEVFVSCNEGGAVLHGTLSSSGVGVSQNLGQTPGSAYSISVTATFTIDLSATRTSPAPALAVVTQGSLTFMVGFSGTMQAVPNGIPSISRLTSESSRAIGSK